MGAYGRAASGVYHDVMVERGPSRIAGRAAVFREFECPVCEAYNAYDDGFGHKDEVFCSFCGSIFDVRVDKEADPGVFRLIAN